jgi:hypothetical protein
VQARRRPTARILKQLAGVERGAQAFSERSIPGRHFAVLRNIALTPTFRCLSICDRAGQRFEYETINAWRRYYAWIDFLLICRCRIFNTRHSLPESKRAKCMWRGPTCEAKPDRAGKSAYICAGHYAPASP